MNRSEAYKIRNIPECNSEDQYTAWLEEEALLPSGFKIGTTSFSFTPKEFTKEVKMNLTVIAADESTPTFSAMFTSNAFPGAPVVVGRERLSAETVRGIVINNKISNVGVRSGVDDAEAICAFVAKALKCSQDEIFPASTGVIGWSLPVSEMLSALPTALNALQSKSIFPAARAIMTTDLYPKIRRAEVQAKDGTVGSIVAIAKGAGMIEPNLATMLVFILTDIDIPREELNSTLKFAVSQSFNSISIDSDQSTSDSVFCLSSNKIKGVPTDQFAEALALVCTGLARDIVRNGEGVHHVIDVAITGAPSSEVARKIGKALVNSPLVKTAIAGNDPNFGRILSAIGSCIGNNGLKVDLRSATIKIGDDEIFKDGFFALSREKEKRLGEYLKGAELYSSETPKDGGMFQPPVKYPRHQRSVKIQINLNCGAAQATVWGADLTHEYVSENADYRS